MCLDLFVEVTPLVWSKGHSTLNSTNEPHILRLILKDDRYDRTY